MATYSNHPGWPSVFHKAYGKSCRYYGVKDLSSGEYAGLGLLVFMKNPWAGKLAVALPYLDFGGPMASNPYAEEALVKGLIKEANQLGYGLELRSASAFPFLPTPQNSKVAMSLSLQGKTMESYWKALDAKVRNQVRKAEKSGIELQTGGRELLSDFYAVFCVNMRDLGSPVHSQTFFENVLTHIQGTEIVNAYRENRCIGGLIRIRFGKSLAIPWASTLREERIYSPNNALYHDAIRFAFEKGLEQVDFGRSTRDEGTYKFKKQWLAEEKPLFWYPFDAKGQLQQAVAHVSSSKWDLATKIWSKLPLSLANRLGAQIRPYIPA